MPERNEKMRITFEKEILENAVNDSFCAVSDVKTYQTLECIRFRCEDGADRCNITTYDLNKGFMTDIPCRVERGGNYLINAAKLNRIIKFLPDRTVTIDVNEKNIVNVTSGRAKFEIHALSGETFPNTPELDGEKGFTIEADVLKDMIGQVYFAVALTDQRPILCGAFFQVTDSKLKLVSCDGNRLAVRETVCKLGNCNKDSSELNLSFIVPGKTLSQLMRLMNDGEVITVLLARKHVIFRLSDKVFFSRLIEGNYIDYKRIIPTGSRIFATLNRLSLISSLERASLVAEDRSLGQVKPHVRFDLVGGVLKVSANSLGGSVYDEVSIEKQGEDIAIGFNCRYFLDALKSADSEMIKLSITSPFMGVIITSADEKKEEDKTDYLYIVSPVRMN